ncbi:MAG: hypothetical protein G01um101417_101 [Parcubacteria group bacterium Gr01-1014_17]|nr:MAG: hypothetical protein G01um101417_101 [Parcubacteria group bacterium Gr01-1014_17]
MKKLLIFSALVFFALPAFAATINFVPATASVTQGETISFVIKVDAGDEKIVTVKTALSYPQDLLEPVSFLLTPNAVQLAQPGYDQMKDGIIVKTAGFPGGFTGIKEFGTLVFKAKQAGLPAQAGVATVSVSNDSLLLNTQSANRLNDLSSAVITIAAPPAPVPALLNISEAKLVPEIDAPQITSPEVDSSTATTSAQSAAIAGLNNQPLRPVLILTLLIIAALAGLVWRMYRRSNAVL